MTRVEALGRALISLPAPRDEITTATGMQQLTALRDEVLLTASDLREIDVKRVAESTSDTRSLRRIVGGGFLALGLSLVAGIGLARFVVA
jgi:hypothetical protein